MRRSLSRREGAGSRSLDWRRNLVANRNRTSDYRIFPALLALMDYDRGDIAGHYGEPLDQPTRDPFTFNTDYYVLLSRDPSWKKPDLAHLARAPAGDFAPMPAGGARGACIAMQ